MCTFFISLAETPRNAAAKNRPEARTRFDVPEHVEFYGSRLPRTSHHDHHDGAFEASVGTLKSRIVSNSTSTLISTNALIDCGLYILRSGCSAAESSVFSLSSRRLLASIMDEKCLFSVEFTPSRHKQSMIDHMRSIIVSQVKNSLRIDRHRVHAW